MTHPETVTPPHPALDDTADTGGPYLIGRPTAERGVATDWDGDTYASRAVADKELAEASDMYPRMGWRIYQLTDVTDQKGV